LIRTSADSHVISHCYLNPEFINKKKTKSADSCLLYDWRS